MKQVLSNIESTLTLYLQSIIWLILLPVRVLALLLSFGSALIVIITIILVGIPYFLFINIGFENGVIMGLLAISSFPIALAVFIITCKSEYMNLSIFNWKFPFGIYDSSFKCWIFGHNWNGCVCIRCGKIRDEQHDWDGCVCRRCSKKRDEEHNWDGCKCLICGKTRDNNHDWNGCKCRRCGKTRYEEHDWNGCTCTICGTVRNTEHIWKERYVEVEYQVASSYESGNEYGPYHTESYFTGQKECVCSICGKRK